MSPGRILCRKNLFQTAGLDPEALKSGITGCLLQIEAGSP